MKRNDRSGAPSGLELIESRLPRGWVGLLVADGWSREKVLMRPMMKACLTRRMRRIVALLWAAMVVTTLGQKQPVTKLADLGPIEGRFPVGGLTAGAGGFYYGVTSGGGQNFDGGTVFRMKVGQPPEWLNSFPHTTPSALGKTPGGGLTRGRDGQFYGVTQEGGVSNHGTIFKMTPTGSLTTFVSFNNGSVAGRQPLGALVQDAKRNWYGVTRGGGSGDHGTVYKVAPDGTHSLMVGFTGNAGAAKGGHPTGSLVLWNGELFGMTESGGAGGGGTVFRVTLAGVLTTMAEFSAGTGPVQPTGGLVLGPDRQLYGATEFGGADGLGTIFRITPAGALTVVKEFTGQTGEVIGKFPKGGMVVGADKAFYGTTSRGGVTDDGVVFRLTSVGEYRVVMAFSGAAGERPGDAPTGRLLPIKGGKLLGVTQLGGVANRGTVFQVDGSGTYALLHEFTANNHRLGANPSGKLARAADGTLFGTSRSGGVFGHGMVFKVSPKGAVSPVFSFTGVGGDFPGSFPDSGLVVGPDGRFYGTTIFGGASDLGTVFAVSRTGQFSLLGQFTGTSGAVLGASPSGSLIMGADGRLMGTTTDGGVHDRGTVFALSTAGQFESMASFDFFGTPAGSDPTSISLGPDDHYYGAYSPAGQFHRGIFRMTPAGVLSERLVFSGNAGAVPGSDPVGELTVMPDGFLYGVTRLGGSSGEGTIFRLGMGGEFESLAVLTGSFGARTGGRPVAGLTRAGDGKLYGTTTEFGLRTQGTVFRVSTTGVIERLKICSPAEGEFPSGPLMLDPKGLLFGVTLFGGRGSIFRSGTSAGAGTVFKVDPRERIPTPLIRQVQVTGITRNAATFRVQVNPSGFATEVDFVVTGGLYNGVNLGSLDVGSGSKWVTLTLPLTAFSLQPSTAYALKVVARNGFGETESDALPFMTVNTPPTATSRIIVAPPPGVPTVIYEAATHTADIDGTPRTLSVVSYNGVGEVTTNGATVTYTGAAFTGLELITIRVEDGFGGSATGYVQLASGTGIPTGLVLGSPMRGRGPALLAPPNSSVASFGTPSQFGGFMVASGQIWQGSKRLPAILGGVSPMAAIFIGGMEAPNLPGVRFASFGEVATRVAPAYAAALYVFPATLTGAGVNAGNRSALFWVKGEGAEEIGPEVLVRAGQEAPDAGGAVFTAFTGLLVTGPTEYPLVVAKLRSQGTAVVSNANNTGVWGEVGGQLRLLLRTGDSIAGASPAAVVKSIALPQTVPGSPAERRHEPGPVLFPQVTFMDNSKGILAIETGEVPELLIRTGQTDGAGRQYLTLGFADVDRVNGERRACLAATWRPGTGDVTMENDSGVILTDGVADMVLAREGGEPPGVTGAEFAGFNPPIAADESDSFAYVAFEATLRGVGIGKANNRGIWVYPRNGVTAPYLLARIGDGAPGMGGSVFAKFDSMASLSDLARGLAFTATVSGGGATSANHYGLWATNNGGPPVLIFRTGQKLPHEGVLRTVKAFTVLKGVPISTGQDRTTSPGWDAIALRTHFTDGTSAVMNVNGP